VTTTARIAICRCCWICDYCWHRKRTPLVSVHQPQRSQGRHDGSDISRWVGCSRSRGGGGGRRVSCAIVSPATRVRVIMCYSFLPRHSLQAHVSSPLSQHCVNGRLLAQQSHWPTGGASTSGPATRVMVRFVVMVFFGHSGRFPRLLESSPGPPCQRGVELSSVSCPPYRVSPRSSSVRSASATVGIVC
jgi:hypothetical protein